MIRTVAGAVLLVAVLACAPLPLSDFWIFVLVQMMDYALYAVAFNLLLGYGGMLAFGFATFFGLGAYTLGILQVRLGFDVVPAVLAAPLVASLFAAVIGYFCVRLSGIYFGMLTFAFQMLAYAVFIKSYDLAGGDDGLHGLVVPGIVGTPRGIYYVSLAIVALCLWVLARIGSSPFGLALRAQRSNVNKSLAIGINVKLEKWLAFVIASFFAGVSGALSGLATQSVFPDWLDWRASAVPIVMAILGGTQRFIGPVIGACVYVVLQTVITGMTEYWSMIMGVLIIGIVVLMPNGIVGFFRLRHE
jgi:branched-chain amino acid transport system permease protein